MVEQLVYENIKYTRTLETYEQKYIAVRMSLENHKLNYNNPYFGPDYRQEVKWMMSTTIRRFGQFFIEEDAISKERETYMYGTGVVDQKGFEHTTPLGSDKNEDTGRLNQFFRNEITVDELLFSPICRVHKELDHRLRGKAVYLNEDPTHFFNRYLNSGYTGKIKTWRGDEVDMKHWDFNDHISQVIKPHPIWGNLWKRFSQM